MVKSRLVFLLSLLLLLVIGPGGTALADQASPKEMLMERLEKADLTYFDVTGGATGTFTAELKEFTVPEAAGIPAESLKGSSLRLEGSLNTSQKKLRCGINAFYGKNNYSGDIYIDGDKVIISKDLLEAVQSINPMLFANEDLAGVNEYLYTSDKQIGEVWSALKSANPGKVLPVYRDFLLFMLEAVPDKYFTYSDGNVVFSLDQEGLEDVIYSIMLKVVTDRDRFNSLMADLMAAATSQNSAELQKEMGAALDDSISPMSREELKELLSSVNLEKFVVKVSPDTAGPIMISSAMKITADDFSGRLEIDTNISGSRDSELKSNYSFSLNIGDSRESFEVGWKGESSQTGGAVKEKDVMEFSMLEGGEEIVRAVVNYNTDLKEDAQARVDIPVLTAANSTDMEKLKKQLSPTAVETEGALKVFLDGKPVAFDVAPYMKDGRVMVPVRTLAEALGFQVEWVDPDQVVMTRDGQKLVMFEGRSAYTVSGESRQMDVSPLAESGRIVVPLRFVAQEMGCRVEYSESENSVYIYTDR